jgi:hypothetical protein
VRVWSTEWWVDREGALERLHGAISTELQAQRAREAELQRAREIEAAAAAEAMEAEGEAIAERDADHGHETEDLLSQDPGTGTEQGDQTFEPVRLVARGPSSDGATAQKRVYRMADLSGLEPSFQPSSFHEATYDSTIEQCIRGVLEQEAPILDKVLVDRVARAHGFKRSGRLIHERVLDIAERHFHFQPDPEPDHGCFVWLAADDPDRWNTYRVPERGEDVRPIEELAPEEVLSAARAIKTGDAVVEIARIFGTRRLSAAARSRLLRIMNQRTDARPQALEID